MHVESLFHVHDVKPPQSVGARNHEASVTELVVTGVAHLLSNNIDAGMKHCLSLCYDNDVRLRSVFMKAFTRVLNLGTKFDAQQAAPQPRPQDTLCEVIGFRSLPRP